MFVSASAWQNSVNAAIGWVGMLTGPRALKSLYSIEKIQPKMIVDTFNGNLSITTISSYSPSKVSDEIDLISFYNELSFTVRSTTKHDFLSSVET